MHTLTLFRFSVIAPIVAFMTLLMPGIAGAVRFTDTLNLINQIINAFIPILISLAIVMFFWGLVQYLLNINKGDAERAQGAQIMIWGIVAIFVMVSIWGIIKLLQSTFSVSDRSPVVPKAIELSDTFRR